MLSEVSLPGGTTGLLANFDKDSETSPAGVVNNEMRHLEEAGWARSFRVHGKATLQFKRVEKL
ncbi:hypothetical protein [Nocardia fluminea]|uniref:hypothetical protein n=1 Tax=Nocardia fluminea TaxID=134984 RepID=UPI00343A8D2F